MPPDPVRYFQWFMTDSTPFNRTVAYEWWSEGAVVESMTLGTLYFYVRDTPSDIWEPARQIGGKGETTLSAARKFAQGEGFSVEVAVQ